MCYNNIGICTKGGGGLFGYVQPFKPIMRVCEWDLYKAFYCGLCRKIKSEYGAAATAALSYDMVFVSILAAAVDEKCRSKKLNRENFHCPLSPCKNRICVSGEFFDCAAAAQVLLTFYKTLDDITDERIVNKLKSLALLPFFALPFLKARRARPALAAAISRAMKLQRKTESRRTRSLDIAAEPTAAMTSAVLREIGACDPDLRKDLGEMGYMLGRFIYFCDALDDLGDDLRRGRYNVFAERYKDIKAAKSGARSAVNMTLGQLGEVYGRVRLRSHGQFCEIVDNIIYYGLSCKFEKTEENCGRLKTLRKERKKHGDRPL